MQHALGPWDFGEKTGPLARPARTETSIIRPISAAGEPARPTAPRKAKVRPPVMLLPCLVLLCGLHLPASQQAPKKEDNERVNAVRENQATSRKEQQKSPAHPWICEVPTEPDYNGGHAAGEALSFKLPIVQLAACPGCHFDVTRAARAFAHRDKTCVQCQATGEDQHLGSSKLFRGPMEIGNINIERERIKSYIVHMAEESE